MTVIRYLACLRRRLACCLVLVCTLPASASAAKPSLVFVPYAFETEAHGTIPAEVAFLDVPRLHAAPAGPRMRLRVVRLPATDATPGAPPVIYLAGGPGGSGVGTARGARWPVFDQVRRHSDVLLLDQRGTGLSDRAPECPYRHRFADAEPLQREAALVALQAAAARCVAWWQGNGVDLRAYTTAESADDIDALRRALGVPKVSVWGMSYGTHLAMAAARQHPSGIDRMVLMGTEGPDHTLKLPLAADALLEELGDVAEKDGFTDLVGSTRRVLASLRQAPAQGRSLMHKGRRVTVGEFDAQLAIAAALGRRSTQQMLPLALREAERGNVDVLATLVLAVREQLGQFEAMPLAMDAASGQSTQRRALAAMQADKSLFGDALNFPHPMLADHLGLMDLGEAFRAPLQTDIPALLVNGTLDGRTPMANVESLLPDFSNASQLQVYGASHDDELWLGTPGIAEAIGGFLDGKPTAAIARLDIPAPVFAKSSIELLENTLGISRWAVLVGAVTAAVILFLPPILLIRWRRRSRARLSTQRS